MEQIGRYRILDELGRGATGIVYRAQDPAIGRVIAIKTIRLSDFTDETERDRLRERLFREAQSAGILSHPNIVTIYDIAEESGLAYIFMEYVEGPALERLLNGPDPLDRDGMLSIFRQTAIALDYAHKKGIVHRDIKPANILIHDANRAKITDFGVAKILSQQMTQNGAMMGTPNYMSPEQVQGHAVDGRADQFSLAVIAYEILTGEKPFVADHLPSLLFRIVREDPVPPQRLNPSLGPQVEAVLRKALSKPASERYASCVEFIEALSGALNATPAWHPMPRSGAQTMPTVGGGAPMHPAAVHAPPPPSTDSEPATVTLEMPAARQPLRDDADGTNPLLKGLVWVLVGIGLVGLVLFGAQKFLLNRNAEPAPITAESQPQPQPTQPAKPAEAPSTKPSPVGQPKTPDETASSTPPSDAPQSTNPEKSQPKDNQPNDTSREITPPVTPPKPGLEKTVQLLTDPPGAQVTVDENSALTCKTPCMLSVPLGRHSLSAQLNGYRSFPRVFNVPQDSDIFLQLNKAVGTLSVTSTPPGAFIEINGENQAKHTPALFNLPPGTYHVKVARGGAFLDFDVQVRDGEFLTRNVTF
ncbi:MAG TPA: protein kinase [Bryobacteraceae bacterium]|nr:protein kinase [Bryobacteraceae bacterium]